MAVDPALLEILVCPECKVPVQPVHDGAGLKCPKCHRVYPVRDDIPVMLVDEATVEP
ncbi:MAG: Trm112 family protein [Vicinamibacterales bacterium]